MSFDKNSMKNRINENHKKRDDYSMIDKEMVLNIPEGVKLYKASYDKKNKIIILPYPVNTNNDPKVKKGDSTYILEYFVHKEVGINKDQFLCMKRTYGKACPICEEIDRLKENYDENEDLIKKLNPSKKAVYNVLDCLDEKPGKIQIFHASYALFEKEMLEEAKASSKGEDVICFPDPSEDGFYIKFRAIEGKFMGKPYAKYKSFEFEKRNKAIPEKILSSVFCLDELLIIPTYEQVKSAFVGDDFDQDDDDEEEEEDNYFDDVAANEIEDEEHNSNGLFEDLEEDNQDDEEDEEEEKFDDEEEEEKPKNKKVKEAKEKIKKLEKTSSSIKKETKRKSKIKEVKEKVCSAGHKFGVDTDKKKECVSCKDWEDCTEKKEMSF